MKTDSITLTDVNGERFPYTPADEKRLAEVQARNGCGDAVCADPESPNCVCTIEAWPWVADAALRHKLEDAGWRYATLVGVVDPDDCPGDAEIRQRDRERYGHMVRRCAFGRPLWDDAEATTFVHEITGASREVCAAWMDHDWPL